MKSFVKRVALPMIAEHKARPRPQRCRGGSHPIDPGNNRKRELLIFFPCFGGSPDRCAQKNEILDQELASIPQERKSMRELERTVGRRNVRERSMIQSKYK